MEPFGPVICAAAPPFPVIFSVCGEFAASSVIVNAALRTPGPSGANVSESWQFSLAVIAPTQLFEAIVKSPLLEPPRTMVCTCSVAFPELVSTRFCGALSVPSVTVPGKLSGLGFKVTVGAGGGGGCEVPVPDSTICCGLPEALSVTTTVADSEPDAEGW